MQYQLRDSGEHKNKDCTTETFARCSRTCLASVHLVPKLTEIGLGDIWGTFKQRWVAIHITMSKLVDKTCCIPPSQMFDMLQQAGINAFVSAELTEMESGDTPGRGAVAKQIGPERYDEPTNQ